MILLARLARILLLTSRRTMIGQDQLLKKQSGGEDQAELVREA